MATRYCGAAALGLVSACAGPSPGGDGSEPLAELGSSLRGDELSERQAPTLFEAASVRPVAVHEDGFVAVTNTPGNRVELFRPTRGGVTPCGSVAVGMRPVAAHWVGDSLWVVNHLSDSVSVVRVSREDCIGSISQTLLVGDEPRDIVAAESSNGTDYVFVTAAHRGQNVRDASGQYRDPQLTTPGVGRADIFVFDAQAVLRHGAQEPVKIVNLFADTPRALAVGDGKVYAAAFLSGNQTAIVRYQLVIDRGRRSLARLDADGDLAIDEGLSAAERRVEGGYPAVKGHGRCISSQSAQSPPSSNDHVMDVCVRTSPEHPYQALEIVPQTPGAVEASCSCTNSIGELQRTPPLIVKFQESAQTCGSNFSPELGGCWLEPPQNDSHSGLRAAQQWNEQVPFNLPDKDIFTITLDGKPELAAEETFRRVGTTLFSLAVHPKSGKVFVGNTEARNHVRFEGPAAFETQEEAFGNTTVRGHIAESRISVLDPRRGTAKPVHLNAHIDYEHCCAPAPNAETERSLAFPVSLAVSRKLDRKGRVASQQDLYVAALGSDKVAVIPTRRLERSREGEPVQDSSMHIEVPGGPMGLELDHRRSLLYVLARFTNELVVVDTKRRRIRQRHGMLNPEPRSVVEGRRFLYDARNTSSHGDSACASCHIFGDLDGLAWDLGDPNIVEKNNPGPFFAKPEVTSAPLNSHFLALKGAMTTQSLRGMANHGPMHWRGDRRGGPDSSQPNAGAFDESAAFAAFNGAFPGLNGRSQELADEQMAQFTRFALKLTYPPNPIRALDNSLNAVQQRARSRYFGCEITDESMALGQCVDGRSIEEETLSCNCLNPPRFVLGLEERPDYCPENPQCTLDISDFQNTCHGCHTLDPKGNAEFGVETPGFFGSNGIYTNDAVAHILKIPHLRNMYQKVGMFGSLQTPDGIGLRSIGDSVLGVRRGGLLAPQNQHMGDQLRGFGFTHAGEEDTMFHFFSLSGFVRRASSSFVLPNDNRGGFEPVLPLDPQACFDTQLPTLNNAFLQQLAPPARLEQLRASLGTVSSAAATAEDKAAAAQRLGAFIDGLAPENPGSVFQLLPTASAASQLALPLAACPNLPDGTTLTAMGCFELAPEPTCAPLMDLVRGCSLWGATLEEVLPNGMQACLASGIRDKADMESLAFAFDSNVRPIVGQQVTLHKGGARSETDRLQLLFSQAEQGNCDVVASGPKHDYTYDRGWLRSDKGRTLRPKAALRTERVLTYTAVPRGEGFGHHATHGQRGEPHPDKSPPERGDRRYELRRQ